MTILPKAIYGFNAILIKIPMTFFTELKQKISQFVWKHKRPRIAKAVLRGKKRSWRNQSPWLQTILQSYSNQDNMVLSQKQKYRSMEWDNSPEINPHTCGQLIYDKGWKDIQWRKDSLFSKWCWENWTANCKRMKLEYSLVPYRKINSKWIKDQMWGHTLQNS